MRRRLGAWELRDAAGVTGMRAPETPAVRAEPQPVAEEPVAAPTPLNGHAQDKIETAVKKSRKAPRAKVAKTTAGKS